MDHRRLLLLAAMLLAALLALPAAGSAAPSCAEGPETVGTTIIGTPCADVIRLPRAVTTVHGEGGDDLLYGQRGNDRLFGGEGADRLFGGVGDDMLRGGPDGDRLFGGFGADSLDGEAGNDLARGDATIDFLGDSGGGLDTLSFATGVTPGFPNTSSFFTNAGFPAGADGRGVFVDLGDDFANNGLAPSGGGVDEPLPPAEDFGDFESVIGTPFPDYLVGTEGAETFHGGGGADLIDGKGGGDTAFGGADGDGCVGVAVEDCENNSEEVDLRDPGAIAVGVMAPNSSAGPAVYLTGSDGEDLVTASYAPNAVSPDPDDGVVTFTLSPGSEGQFEAGGAGGCAAPAGGAVSCAVPEPPDSVLLAGLMGDDVLLAPSFPETVAVVLLGNQDGDQLTGGETEDTLVDGAGNDTVAAGGRDDALPNNGGDDQLDAGSGEDLFISNAVCDGDLIDGGPDRDNANWANFGTGVAIDMGGEAAGLIGPQGQPQCATTALLTTLQEIEDVEGTNVGDNLVGDTGPNQLLGRAGPDNYLAGAGNDHLLVNSGDSDPTVDCGEGFDTALIDFAPHADGPPVACESVEERAPNSFRPPDTPPDPDPENPPDPDPENPPDPDPETPPVPDPETPSEPERTPPQPPQGDPPQEQQPDQPVGDSTAPATKLRRGLPALLFTSQPRRRVVFAFSASEPGVQFRCSIDRQPFHPCRSPRAYLVAPGRHLFRVLAIDAAGNRDGSPALFRFRVRSL